MIKAYLSFVLSSLFLPVLCQQQVLDVNAPGAPGSSYGSVSFYDPSTLGIRKEEHTNYSDMTGTPFWDDHWNAAHLIMKNGGVIKVNQVKINLYSSDIYYIYNGVELEAEKGSVQKVLLFKQQDTSKILALFEYYPDVTVNNSPSPVYYRVLNTGKVRLLLLQKSLVNTAPYDPLTGIAKKNFYAKTYYALSNNGNISYLKTLDHTNLFTILSPDAASEAWLKKNNNRLKKEAEVLSFLTYYNNEYK